MNEFAISRFPIPDLQKLPDDIRARIEVIHEKTGFITIGTLKNVGWKFEKWIDTVVMQLALQKSN